MSLPSKNLTSTAHSLLHKSRRDLDCLLHLLVLKDTLPACLRAFALVGFFPLELSFACMLAPLIIQVSDHLPSEPSLPPKKAFQSQCLHPNTYLIPGTLLLPVSSAELVFLRIGTWLSSSQLYSQCLVQCLSLSSCTINIGLI